MEDVKDIIAKNLVELRTRAKLTQIQLANMLNYSDKAVSKWERGDAVPDLRVLIKLSEIYGVTVDDIVKSKDITLKVHPKKLITGKRGFVVAMSSVLVWFVATIIFIVLFSFPVTQKYAYLCNSLKELFSNGIRHGKASAFYVELANNGSIIKLLVSDNGSGVSGAVKEGFGLRGIREKAEKMGGTCCFTGEEDEGFEVTIILPDGGAEVKND